MSGAEDAEALSTESTAAARVHARSQADTVVLMTPTPPDGVRSDQVIWTERIPPACYANIVLGRGSRLRFSDPDGAGCAHLFLLRSDAPWERLNVADTLKVPWQAYLGVGHPLLSDQGRVLATVVADTSSKHDALCGATPVGRASLSHAAAKQGLEPRDVAGTVSLFRGARVRPNGDLVATGNAPAGSYLDLLIHLPVTLLVANAPHPLDDRVTSPVDVVSWHAASDLTALSNHDPEYLRAVRNTELAWNAGLSRPQERS